MDALQIRLVLPEGEGDPQALFDLRRDLDQHVGPAEFAEPERVPGEKGSAFEIATMVVTIISPAAVAALAEVVKSYFDRDRLTEIIVTGPKGTAILRLPPSAKLSAEEIRLSVEATLRGAR